MPSKERLHESILRVSLLALLFTAATPVQACGACGCTLHSDWATQGYMAGLGFRFDLRYDYFNQDQLRSGTRSVDRDSFDFPNGQEIQRKTLTRNLTATLDYSPNTIPGRRRMIVLRRLCGMK